MQPTDAAVTADIRVLLSSYGLADREEELLFVRNVGEYEHQYQLVLRERDGRRFFVPSIGLRCFEIENIYNQHSEYSASQAATTATLAIDFTRLAPNENHFAADIAFGGQIAADVVSRWFDQHAAPFYARYASLREIDLALNSHPNQPCLFMIHERGRCGRGLVAAKLVGRKNYDELVDIYTTRCKAMGLATFRRYIEPLIATLESH